MNGDNVISAAEVFPTGMRGIPFVGDFDGNGFDDLATYNNNTGGFQFIMLAGAPTAAAIAAIPAPASVFLFAGRGNFSAAEQGFSGFGDRPLAGDVNLDGIDDIVLWVPGREGQLPKEAGEFYFLVSDAIPAPLTLPGLGAARPPSQPVAAWQRL